MVVVVVVVVVVLLLLLLLLLKSQVFPECYTVSLDKLTPRIILLHLWGQAVPTCQAFGDLKRFQW